MFLWADDWLRAMAAADAVALENGARNADSVHILLGVIRTTDEQYWADLGLDSPQVALLRGLLLREAINIGEGERQKKAWPMQAFFPQSRRKTGRDTEYNRCNERFLEASKEDLQAGKFRTPLQLGHLVVVALQPGSRAVGLLEEAGFDAASLYTRAYETLLQHGR